MTLSTKPTRRYPSLPDPGDSLASHSAFLRAVRSAVQTHERRDEDKLHSFVRLGELIELGLIKMVGDTLIIGDEIINTGGGGGGGVTDHGALTGLADDDHTQYVLRSILTTNGDLFTRVAGAIARLGIGAEGDVLTVASGLPSWAAPAGGADPWYYAPYDDPPVSPNAMDDEFDDNSFDTTKWTWGNQGGATITESAAEFGHALLNTPGNSGDQYRLLYQTLPAAPWRFRCKMIGRMTLANFAHSGLFVRNSANGRLYAFGPLYASGQGMYIQAMTSVSAYSSTPYALGGQTFDTYWWLDIEHNGTNLIFRHARLSSLTAWSPFSFGQPTAPFTTALTVAPATFLLATPDQIGFQGDSNNSNSVQTYMDWFRRIS